ncbi:MAG: ABC transporter ATP-binding protein [Planctomycetaceae bacterium]|nr:ABC transporter ATP-binding protein [Planctomycetaceae bacterium]
MSERGSPPAERQGYVSTPVAEFFDVTKWYGPIIGVNDVSLELQPGITGLLGPNGAGKTTLIKLLTGQLRPTIGKVLVRGATAFSAAAKRHIGYCPEVDVFYEEMSGRKFVRTMARLHGMSQADAREQTERALHEVGMSERADRTLRGYSKGMRQRIRLAQALVHQPDLLVVDEPLNGVDPVGRRELMGLFRMLADHGTAVLLSSHILEEMDDLVERIIFMGRGRVLAVGSVAEIRDMFADLPLQVRLVCAAARELASELIRWTQVQGLELTGPEELALRIIRADSFFRQLAALVAERGFDIARLETTDVTAEATFGYVMSAAAEF